MHNLLQIFTLGNLQIKRNGALLTGFATRKVEALLVYLACTRTTHARSTLAELLWQDRTTEQSLANLRAALSRLGQQVGPFLDVNRQTLAVSPEAGLWLDVTELQAALASLSLAEHQTSSSAIEKAEQALTLFRGDFLNGFSVDESRGFEEWVSVQREYLRIQVIDGLSRMVRYYLKRRDTGRGLPHDYRLIAL